MFTQIFKAALVSKIYFIGFRDICNCSNCGNVIFWMQQWRLRFPDHRKLKANVVDALPFHFFFTLATVGWIDPTLLTAFTKYLHSFFFCFLEMPLLRPPNNTHLWRSTSVYGTSIVHSENVPFFLEVRVSISPSLKGPSTYSQNCWHIHDLFSIDPVWMVVGWHLTKD